MARAIVASAIDEFVDRVSQEGERQTAIAVAYFTEQLIVAQGDLTGRQAELEEYVAAHPDAPLLGPGDIEYRSLLAAVETQNEVKQRLELSLQDWHLNAASAAQGHQSRFNVQDLPLHGLPIPVSRTKRFILPLAALVFGGVVSGGFLYVTVRADHTIRSSEDLEGLGVPLIGYVPEVTAGQNQPWYKLLRRRERHFARRLATSLAIRTSTSGDA